MSWFLAMSLKWLPNRSYIIAFFGYNYKKARKCTSFKYFNIPIHLNGLNYFGICAQLKYVFCAFTSSVNGLAQISSETNLGVCCQQFLFEKCSTLTVAFHFKSTNCSSSKISWHQSISGGSR